MTSPRAGGPPFVTDHYKWWKSLVYVEGNMFCCICMCMHTDVTYQQHEPYVCPVCLPEVQPKPVQHE